MKITLNHSYFIDTFRAHGRYDQMGGYHGLKALYQHLEEWERDTGQEIELDVIGLCCDWSHYDSLADAYAELIGEGAEGEEAMLEALEYRATVIQYKDGCFVSQF